MTRRTRWLYGIPFFLGISAVLVAQHRAYDRAVRCTQEARGALRQRAEGPPTADTVAAVRTVHEVLMQERWAEAAVFTPAGEMAGPHAPLAWAAAYFARAVGAARMDQTARARHEIEELRVLQDGLVATRQGDWAAHVEFLSRVAAAWVARRAGQCEEAMQHLHAAVDREDVRPPYPVTRELLAAAYALSGEMLLECGEPARAVRVLERAITLAPHREDALYRAARASELAGDLAKASEFYTQMLECPGATIDEHLKAPQARAFLANLTVRLP